MSSSFKKATMMDADLRRWQARMAPLMAGAVVVTALFFAFATVWKFGDIEARLLKTSTDSAAAAWSAEIKPKDFGEQMRLESTRASFNLERDLVARRYEQGNLAFVSRLWTRFMGFVTGMILALVGAAFVLGKLEADRSELGASGSGLSVTFSSASPGLVLAVLGTILMGLSIALPVTVSVTDGAVYVARPVSSADLPAPMTSSAAPNAASEPQLRKPQ